MKKVLVLEDESSIRSFIVINLRRAGYEVIEAESGEEALEKLARALGVTPAYLTGWEEELPPTLAAHFEGEEFTEDELREIADFVRFVKSRRK